MNKKVLIFSLISIFVVLLVLFSFLQKQKLANHITQIKQNPVQSKAIIRVIESKRNVYFMYDFEVKGQKYTGQVLGAYSFKDLEEISIYYLKDNPNISCYEKEFHE